VVALKTEIDLRSPEFIAANRPFSAALLKKLLVALGMLLLAVFLYGTHYYHGYLQRELEKETATVQALREEVQPLFALLEESALLKTRAGLEQELLLAAEPVPERLLEARQLARAHNLTVERAIADRSGDLFLKGRGRDLQEIAAFNSALEAWNHISSAEVTALSLDVDGDYRFAINASGLKKGDQLE